MYLISLLNLILNLTLQAVNMTEKDHREVSLLDTTYKTDKNNGTNK